MADENKVGGEEILRGISDEMFGRDADVDIRVIPTDQQTSVRKTVQVLNGLTYFTELKQGVLIFSQSQKRWYFLWSSKYGRFDLKQCRELSEHFVVPPTVREITKRPVVRPYKTRAGEPVPLGGWIDADDRRDMKKSSSIYQRLDQP